MKKISGLFVTLLLLSCVGGSSETLHKLSQGGGQQQTGGSTMVAKITLTPNPPALIFGGRSSITVEATTDTGTLVPGGITISFTSSDSTIGMVSPIVITKQGTTTQVLFTAGNTPGTATITAMAGSVTGTTVITVNAPETGSLEFLSASPPLIGIKGSGQQETSIITFLVKDIQGNPVHEGTPVTFQMAGPNGGEYIGTTTGLKEVLSATQKGGRATVILNSGSVAGSVHIIASAVVGGKTVSSSAPAISIGGGVVSARHFTLATSRFNLPGLTTVNATAQISAWMADRYGNDNILAGTAISFYTEAGAIAPSDTTDDKGIAQVTLRTQAPMPVDIDPLMNIGQNADGHVTVLATVIGEEAFDDANANGRYDSGETFSELPEPFLDIDNNGTRTDGTQPKEPFEFYIDKNGNGKYDPNNGVWDGPGCTEKGCEPSKVIWKEITLAFTGNAYRCRITSPSSSFTIPNGQAQSFTFELGDVHDIYLTPGTTVSVEATKGDLAGMTRSTLADSIGGPFVAGFSLADSDSKNVVSPSESVTVKVTVKPSEGSPECSDFIYGTIE